MPMQQIITKDPMTYKEQKKENELLVKLRIIKDRIKAGKQVKNIAYKYTLHRNTVRNIIKQFEKLDKERQAIVLNSTLTQEDLIKYLMRGTPKLMTIVYTKIDNLLPLKDVQTNSKRN